MDRREAVLAATAPSVAPKPAISSRGCCGRCTIAGSDAYGKPVSEPVAVFIHWRKHKRMMRKMGQRPA